jgi:hypothetical protein
MTARNIRIAMPEMEAIARHGELVQLISRKAHQVQMVRESVGTPTSLKRKQVATKGAPGRAPQG